VMASMIWGGGQRGGDTEGEREKKCIAPLLGKKYTLALIRIAHTPIHTAQDTTSTYHTNVLICEMVPTYILLR